MSPTRHGLHSLGLPLAYYVWEPRAPNGETVVFLHGYLDHALTFDPVAERLAEAGYRVVAPDHRGHGESGHVGLGGYYHFPDYLLDLANLYAHLELTTAHMVGHSMGATMACYYAGAFNDRARSLVLLDGIGPSPVPAERSPSLIRRWVNDIKLMGMREEAPMASLEEVARRLSRTSPGASPERLLAMARTATEETVDGFRWKFDPLHRTTAPVPFDVARFSAFLAAIRCPTYLIWGERSPMRPPDVEERAALVQDLRRGVLAGAAHNLHHERPEALSDMVLAFLADLPRGEGA